MCRPGVDRCALRVYEDISSLEGGLVERSAVDAVLEDARTVGDTDGGPKAAEVYTVQLFAAAFEPDEIAPRRIGTRAFDRMLRVRDAAARCHHPGEDLRLAHSLLKDQA